MGARTAGRGRRCAAATGSSAAGAGDDGYASFAALTAIEALQAQGVPHARCVVLIEASEESGSPDLPAYVEQLADRIRPGLVVCLDSGCGDYDHLWATTSLRGVVSGTLTVEVLGEGVHSGAASGIVPSSFRILRQVLDRLEDQRTGKILVEDCHVEIPPARLAEVRAVAGVLGDDVWRRFPFLPGMRAGDAGPGRGAAEQHVAARPCRSPGWTACPRSPTPATCCVRRRR